MILRVPGDKSISQRALILAVLADGESRLTGLLPGADPASTAAALQQLGGEVGELPPDGAEVRIRGRGLRGLVEYTRPLDLGNSGTGARLLMGVLAACPFEAVLTGDASLRSRPMRRVTDPLSLMGARFESLEMEDRLPIRMRGGALRALEYELPVASAQIKSSLLLAGLAGGVAVTLDEPGRSRDHTERMFRQVGVAVTAGARGHLWRVELRDPPEGIPPLDFHVPGDFSSAAFLLAAGLLGVAGDAITIADVGVNPTRTGFLPLLERMGGAVELETGPDDGGEPVGRLTVRPSELRGAEVGAADVVLAIDEIPVLAALAARARGTTRITGAHELRVKETDRISALVEGLRAVGVDAEELEDGLVVEGTGQPLHGVVDARLDHRIAMSFGVLGAVPGNDITVLGADSVDVSFPEFWTTLAALRRGTPGSAQRPSGAPRPDVPRRSAVVTLDGPAGSGKSTTAREVARRLGFRHLDSGALYRALTHALLEDGVPPSEWPRLTRQALEAYPLELRPGAGERLDILLEGRPLEDGALRRPEVTSHVSFLSTSPAVRAWLLDRQREAARLGGLVADGRDMGTVVFPDADLKVFITADLDARARRRLCDHGVPAPDDVQIREEAERIRGRDLQDSTRSLSPLRPSGEAWTLDTTGLDFESQVRAILERAEARLRRQQ